MQSRKNIKKISPTMTKRERLVVVGGVGDPTGSMAVGKWSMSEREFCG